MFKLLTDLEGYQVAIKNDTIIAVHDDGEFRIVVTAFEEFEVQETMQEIFKIPLNSNNVVTFSKN